MPRDCTFHGAWLRDNEFSSWVEGVDDKCMAHCRLCDSTFSIRNRGIGQLRSHAEKEKHCSLVQKRKNQVVFDTVLNVSGMKEVQLSLPSGPCKVWSLSHGEQICRATALWSMKVAIAGYSFRSCSGIPNLFSLMFPDSLIARDLTLDEDKCSYVIAHGLGPYFHEETVRAVKTSKSCFCLELDETTTSSGDKQLDTYLRFWDEAKGSVVVHYYKSHLLGHAEASVLQSAVLDSFSMDVIPLQRFIHLSSDGPNVNKTLFAFLDAEVKSSRGGQVDLGLLNIGTCNLHVVHNAFACGMGKLAHWSIDTFLKDIYSWMKSSSVRKSDFLDIEKEFSSDGKLPLYYAKWRWLTVVPSVVRAQQLKSDLCRYYLEFVPKQYGLVLQDNEKFVRIQKQLRDPCLDARLHFVATVSTAFESFLRIFQKEGPLVHVLHFSLKDLFMSFLKRFLKAENLDGKSVSELMTLAYEDRNYHLKNSELEVGIHTRASLASLTPEARSGFYSDVRTFFISVANYLSTHLPLKNSLLRDLSALDPVRRCEEASIPRFLRLAGKLSPILDKNDLHLCDHAVSEYKQYVVDPRVDSLAKQWNGSQRVDVDFWSHVFHLKQRDSENLRYSNLARVVKTSMCIAHGNADPERGFSINQYNVITKWRCSLKLESINGLRATIDAVTRSGGLENVLITKSMLSNVANARERYHAALQEHKNIELRLKEERSARELAAELRIVQKRNDRTAEDDIKVAQRMIARASEDLKACLDKCDIIGAKAAQEVIQASHTKLSALLAKASSPSSSSAKRHKPS